MTNQPHNPGPDAADEAARDELDDLIAGAGDVLLEDFDPAAARRRLERTLEKHRLMVRGGATAFVGMLLAMWLLPPWLARATGRPGLMDGGRIGLVVLLATVVGLAAWWLVTHRRLVRALAEGPPAMDATVDALERQAGRWDRIIAALGLIGGPAMVLVTVENATTGPWWFTVWLALATVLVLGETSRRALRVHREDRAARAARRARRRSGA